MPRQCHFCGKQTVIGRQISHAHNVSSRTFQPNLRRVRALIDGTPQRIDVCARCLRTGRVVKPPRRQPPEGEQTGL
ncbi:MAG: 50S ribosomal protein L28 [Thermoanaerobaculia bacterium]|jgi:large subunit ribosomal protein L28|nr:50S ribosomal protein L28 [Thermoanaerobaculia bacterium]MDI9632025.1 50S ribosomal protein L28 [Acidobacteriota bacterium]MBP7813027.1 50S ribosomal protein L28 [Thermoanaerobaculia bacterium]MBP8845787.1 50S ribosomal protein L28 [Thermoanaerobaculia bacterium]HNZ95666.1 50S ribosomal protein L28 [Thermoanaerobaculia bacterium]